jgi:hypothetical protein
MLEITSPYCFWLKRTGLALRMWAGSIIAELAFPRRAIVLENCALLAYLAANGGNPLPTFRNNLSVPSPRVRNPRSGAQMGAVRNPKKRCPDGRSQESNKRCPDGRSQESQEAVPRWAESGIPRSGAQMGALVIYFAAEAWNHAQLWSCLSYCTGMLISP